MAASPFGINVVSRSHTVICHTCGDRAARVGETCEKCGASLADSGFAIVAAADADVSRRGAKLRVRRAPAT